MDISPWTSLEEAKLAVSVLTPLLVLVLGIVINNSVKTADRSIGLRSEIYKQIGGDLNDIYGYLDFVGGWKNLSPIDVIGHKRAVDKAMYMYKPFFSKELFKSYKRFMNEAFKPYGGAGLDARIRSEITTDNGDRRKHTSKAWDTSWEDRFTMERNKEAQRHAYEQFLEQLARDLKL